MTAVSAKDTALAVAAVAALRDELTAKMREDHSGWREVLKMSEPLSEESAQGE